MLVKAGELGEARKRFQQSLAMDEKLAAANPGSAEAQRDVSVGLSKLGDVLVKAGELGEARRRFTQSLANGGEAGGGESRECGCAAGRVSEFEQAGGCVGGGGGVGGGAGSGFAQSLEMREKLAAANPGSAEAQRDVSVSLERLGDVLVAAGELREGAAAVCAVAGR